MTQHFSKQPHKQHSAFHRALNDYLNQIKLEWKPAVAVFLLTGIGSILVFYAPPLVIGNLLQRFGDQQTISTSQLIPFISLFAGLWLTGEAFWRIGGYWQIQLEARIIERLYNTAMREMLEKDLSFFHENFSGSLTKKTIAYAKNFEAFFDVLSYSVFSQVLPLIFVSVILWRFSPFLVLGLIGMTGITLLCVLPMIKKRQIYVAERETAYNIASGHIADVFSNIDAVRAFANEPHESSVHEYHIHDALAKAKRTWHYQNQRIELATSPLYVLTNVIGVVIALVIGGSNSTNIAAVFVTFSYYSGFSRIMWEFSRIYRQIESNLSEAAQFTELLTHKPKIRDAVKTRDITINHGTISMNDVSFRYQDNSHNLLFRHLNLHIASGEKIGLVGRSGGGKTTITKLLLRFMDVTDGEILMDEVNIAQITQKTLRSSIAYVPQEPVMFHRSLTDNIKYGKLDATNTEIRRVAKQAHALEFIEALPQGFDTLVGERGVKLSGGQRQRIAIARAMLKNAPILLLDEATSALDSESEMLIQDALWKLMENRTAIVIAHRLSTIQKMDRIIVLDQGKIVEEGTHKELIRQNGTYADLWSHQSGGFLDE